MDALDLFRHLHLFAIGHLGGHELWNYLSDHSIDAEEDLDDDALDAFDTAELVLAEYTSGHIPESAARTRLRELIPQFLSRYHVLAAGRAAQQWQALPDRDTLFTHDVSRGSHVTIHPKLVMPVRGSQRARVDKPERSPGSDMRAQGDTGRLWVFGDLQAV